MSVTRSFFFRVCPWITFASLAACGGPRAGAQTAASDAEISCPAPIGTIARENCGDIAEDFGALSVDGALKLASSSKGAEERIEAIRAAGDLAARVKERRVELCTQYNACKMTLADHNAEDARLAAIMASLIKTWDERKFLDVDGAKNLREQVATLTAQFEGRPVDTSATAEAPQPAITRVLGDKLSKVEGAGVTFSASSGAITASTTAEGARDALLAGIEQLGASSGSRYVVRVAGSYTPAAPALINGSDELTVKFKYRVGKASEVYVALRSLEDPDALETTSTFPIAKPGTGEHQATLTAVPGSSGFYLGIGSKGDSGLELDDVELVRGGSVIASALGETTGEAQIETTCTLQKTKPITGKGSFVCQPGAADVLTIGRPKGHMFIAVRHGESGADKSVLRTLSLEGGRSIDAMFTATTKIVIGLDGPGSATIQAVEVTKL